MRWKEGGKRNYLTLSFSILGQQWVVGLEELDLTNWSQLQDNCSSLPVFARLCKKVERKLTHACIFST